MSIKRFPKPPANVWGGANLLKKIADGKIINTNSKTGRGVGETAPVAKIGGGGEEKSGANLKNNTATGSGSCAATPVVADGGVFTGRSKVTPFAGKTSVVINQNSNTASDGEKQIPHDKDSTMKLTGRGGREAAPVEVN